MDFEATPWPDTPFGRMCTPIRVQWAPDGRTMWTNDVVRFMDSENRLWSVPPRTRIDGASIPRFFWRIIGSPFVGKFRAASVVHDHYCVVQTQTWQATHFMFYEAMLSTGVHPWKAWIMFKAVWYFGPRWLSPFEGVTQ